MDIGPAKTSPAIARPNGALKRLRLAAAITAGLALLAGAGFRPAGGAPLFRFVNCDDAHAAFRRLAGVGVLARAFAKLPHALRFGVPADEAVWDELARRLRSI